MRSVILLPIMGEKLLLTIPEKYVIYLVAVRFDCTRQSSSAAISKEQKAQNYTEPKFNFSSCTFILRILTVTSTPVAVRF